MATSKELSGKVVIVTGGTMGIGFGMATRLASYGATVVISSRNGDSGEAALRRLREVADCAPGNVAYLQMDITSEADNERLVDFAVKNYGRLDAIINNAGGCGPVLKEYGHLLEGTPGAKQGEAFAGKVRDIHGLAEGIARLRAAKA